MNIDDITRMAREAGFDKNSLGTTFTHGKLDESLEKFANLVAAAEREACAKEIEVEICDEIEDEAYCILVTLLARIRARGQK